MEAAAVPGAAAAGRQLWGGHGGRPTGPQARPPHLSPLQGCFRVLLPICEAGNSLCAPPAGLLLKLLLFMSTVLTASGPPCMLALVSLACHILMLLPFQSPSDCSFASTD